MIFFQKKNRKGMSLAEVLIAVTILATVMMALFSTFFYAAKMTQKEQALTQATQLTVTHLEAIKQGITNGADFDSLTSSTQYYFCEDSNYVYDVEVDTLSNSLKYVGVTVYYRNSGNTTPQPDLSKTNLGKITTIGTFINRP